MWRVLYFCLALSFCILQVKSQSSEYTWEDYDGTIPEKAFMASDDPNNPIYVGMAKVGKENCTGTLFPGAKELMVSCNGMHKIKEGIKILIVNEPKKFKWFPTPRATLWIWTEINSVGEPVTCGFSSKTKTATLVARTKTDDDGSLVVGHLNNGRFYLVHTNRARSKSNNYEILIIVEEPVPAPPQSDEYTWEDYNGTIPEKAFSASDDPKNPVYVGLALIYRDYCPGTLLPGATEITVACGGMYTVKEDLKILTVKDPKKFKWLPAPRQGGLWDAIQIITSAPSVTSGQSLAMKNTTTLVGRTITDDGTFDVGHYNYGVFYWIGNNRKRADTLNFEVLIVVNEPPPAASQNEVSKEPSASEAVLNPDQPTADANLDLESAPNAPPASKEPNVDANVDLKADANAQVVPKSPSAPKEPPTPKAPSASKKPAALTPSKPTVDANVDLTADANAQVVPKSQSAPKAPSVPKEPPTPKASSVSKKTAALTPCVPIVDTNVDLKAEDNAQVVPKPPSAPKEPPIPKAQSASKESAALTPPKPTVDANVDLTADANAQVVPKTPSAPKEPPTQKEPPTPKAPAASKKTAALTPSGPIVVTNVDLKAEDNAQVVPKSPSAPKEPPIPKAPSASKEPAALTPSKPTVDANVDVKADANAQVVPKSRSASKEPAVLNLSEPTVDTNVDVKVEADAQTAQKVPLVPKAPPTSKTPTAPKAPADSKVNPFAG